MLRVNIHFSPRIVVAGILSLIDIFWILTKYTFIEKLQTETNWEKYYFKCSAKSINSE